MHTVLNQLTNRSFTIESGENILDAALKNGVSFPYGCQKGMCGRCKAVLVAGDVVYPEPLPKAITDEEIDAGIALLCQAQTSGDVIIEAEELATESVSIETIDTCVSAINRLNHDVVELVLQMPPEQTLSYLSGQYVDISFNAIPHRSFSIANAAKNDGLLTFHIRLIENGVFSTAAATVLKKGDRVTIEGPKGSFYLRENSQKPMIMVAGGTGLGPIKAIIEHQLTQPKTRPIFLYWGVRQQRDFYWDIAQAWLKYINFIPVLSEPDDDWAGRCGLVHQAVLDDYTSLSDYEAYVCGAPIMVDVALESFVKQGLNKANFYADSFDYSGALTS